MTESEDDRHDSGVDCCDACGCDKSAEDLYFCQACKCTFCSSCWETQVAHKSKRKRALRPGATVHEKTKLSIIRLVQPAFSSPADDVTLEARLAEDTDAAWFGVSREKRDDRPLFFHDRGRYAEMMAATADSSAFIRQAVAKSDSPTMPARRTPSLVSFVGQTGAGKSTLIKLLIQLKAPPGLVTPQCPVVGVSGREVPTSEDVHLYLDPSTFLSDAPILYADCEGLDGGEREPLATTFRSKRDPPEAEQTSDDDTSPFRTRYCSKRELQWAKSRAERTRHFAVSQFYPRLLFTFSDVVIFVHRNPRVIENVFEKLIAWAAAALETACNQPILPHAIIILNASENDIDQKLWDVNFATKSLLESLSETVNQNVTFAQYAKFWRDRGREIENVEELMMCYYSSVRVVRLPADTQPNLVHDQAQKLYEEIERGYRNARERKSNLRMLLDAEGLQSYLQDAFDHYSRSLDVPFNFVQASFLHNPIPSNFGGSILKLAIAMAKEEKSPDARAIFNKLGNLVASCIMLDAVRHNVLGTASLIFPQYLEYLDEALEDFYDRHWPCEYVMRGITPASLQYNLDNKQYWNDMLSSPPIYRCVNVRIGHDSKGHQHRDGKIFGCGGYVTRFSFKNNREELHAGVYFRLEHLLSQLADYTRQGESQEVAAAKMHRSNLLEFFHKPSNESEPTNLQNHSVCWCCLFEAPEHALSCGHVLCTPCLKAYGRAEARTIIQIHECPLESYGRCQPRSIYIKPETAGIRMLVLDDGGVRGIIQLEILRLLERELNGRISVQFFFDMIVGKGSGSIIALGLLTSHWTLDDCMANFLRIFKQSFAPRNRRKFPRLKHSTCKYHSKALEQSLQEAFTENQGLFGGGIDGRVGTNTKIAIPVVSSTGKTVIFTNYSRRSAVKLPYQLCYPEDAREEIKTWEAARAAIAHPLLFKPFKHKASSQVYGNKEYDANPVMIADSEFKAVWGSSPSSFPDIVVSLGTGLSTSQSAVPADMENPAKSSEATAHWMAGKKKQTLLRFDQRCEKTWNDYLQFLPISSAPAGNYIRLNTRALELPAVDDINSAESLRNMAGEMERTLGNDLFLRGEILCRIPDGIPEIYEVGKLLREGKFQSSGFIIQEHLCERQYFGIPPRVVDDMIHDRHFRMPEVKIHISQRCAQFDAILHLDNKEEYSISGFPRSIVGKGAQTGKHTRGSSSNTIGIRRRPQWTPPDSARYSSFDSAIQFRDGSRSIPLPSSSPITSVATDAPASRRSSAQSPQELDAHDTRDPRAIQEAIRLQRERDRIRMEEVAPLEERLRKLEASQLESTRILARLQNPSSGRSPQSDGRASQSLIDTPLINFNNDSLNHSRISTVRHENRNPGESSIASNTIGIPVPKNDEKGPTTIREALASKDVGVLEKVLMNNFHQVAKDEYSWLREVDAIGYSMKDIAELLFEQANDSPWIFFEPQPSTGLEIKLDFHLPNCAHKSSQNTSRALAHTRTFPNSEGLNISSPSGIEETERLLQVIPEFCGLAGIAPTSRDLSTWNGGVIFHDDNSTSYVTYGSAKEGEIDERNLILCSYKALQGFCRAVVHVQQASCCCDCFTILRIVTRDCQSDVVEMVRIHFELACQLQSELKSLLSLDNIDRSQCGKCGSIAKGILSILGVPYDKSDNEYVKQHKKQTVEVNEVGEMLHLCCLAVQFLSLGFLSYSQAHCGTIQPFFLDTPQRRVVLQGSKKDSGGSWQIETQLVDLTCIGEMIQDSVIVFSASNKSNHRPVLLGRPKFNLLACPEDLIDTWGPGEFIGRASETSDNLLCAISLGGGIIKAASPEDERFHWSRNAICDTDTASSFEPNTKLLVGAIVTVNNNCVMDEDQLCLNFDGYLENLGTFDSYWVAAQRQAGIQVGQYVSFAYFNTWAKIPASTIKNIQLNLPDNHLLPFLQSSWGLQVSCCTGIARRVSLCELIADVMPAFVESLFPIPKLWKSLKQDHNIIRAFQSNNLQQWLGNLNDECQQLVAVITRSILSVLACTGVDNRGKNFIIAWVRKNKPFQCFKLRCRRSNYWTRILADSGDCATFAYVTSKCLETASLRCRGSLGWQNESTLLETAVCRHKPEEAGAHLETAPWVLKHEDCYLMGKLDSLLWVKVDRENLSTNPRLLVTPSKIPIPFAIRLRSRSLSNPLQPIQRLRERQWMDGRAENVVVLAANPT